MIVTLAGHSLNFIVRQHPTLFHDQVWYRAEKFAGAAHWGTFDLEGDVLCPAAAYADAFVRAAAGGEVLWPQEYIWTSDTDGEGQRVYVGRAAQYGGLQIHRHLVASPV